MPDQSFIAQLIQTFLLLIEAVTLLVCTDWYLRFDYRSYADVGWVDMALLGQPLAEIALRRNIVSGDLVLLNQQLEAFCFARGLAQQRQFFLDGMFSAASEGQARQNDKKHLQIKQSLYLNLQTCFEISGQAVAKSTCVLLRSAHQVLPIQYSALAMRAIHIQKYGRLPVLTKCPVPCRQKGDFLIKMKYAPINPSDLFFYLGLYGIKKEGFPIMGFEGSGVIKQADNKELIGRRVSVLANKNNGTYAEYMVSHESEVLVWPEQSSLSLQEMSMCSVNPYSVLGMADIIRQFQAQTAVLSAAASNTSKMLMRVLRKKELAKWIYGISRSSQHDEELKKAGYNQLFRPQAFQTIKSQLKNHHKSVFMDCVGGQFAGQIFNLLPPGSLMVNYGRLSKENLAGIDLGELYYRNKMIRGFWLNNYLQESGTQKLQSIKQEIIEDSNLFRQKVRQIYPIQHLQEATRQSIKNQSQGKILLRICSQAS